MKTAYQTEKLGEHLYRLCEDLTGGLFPIGIYLITGRKKAALIDTGMGTGDLRRAVSAVTDLPVLVLHTHGHIDHTGADSQFHELYLSADESLFGADERALAEADKQRMELIRIQLAGRPELYSAIEARRIKSAPVTYRKIADGDMIDLGGVALLTVATPGHTPGSLSFVDRENGDAFTGDGIADIHWFDGAASVCVEDFRQMLEYFEKKAAGTGRLFAAHLPQPFDMSLVHDLKHCAGEILDGANDPLENADYQFLKHGTLFAHRLGKAVIYYDNAHRYADTARQEAFPDFSETKK